MAARRARAATTSRASTRRSSRTRAPGRPPATSSTSAIRWSTAAPARSASAPTSSTRPGPARRARAAPSTTSPSRALQPDAHDAHRRVGGRRWRRVPARRDVPADLQRLQARARGVAPADPVRHRPDRQGLPQRDQPAQLHVPLARVRAGRARVLLPPVASARSGSTHWRDERLRFHRDLGFDDELSAHPPARVRASSRTTARRRSTSSSCSRSAGRRSRASTTAATGTCAATASTRARISAVTDPDTKERFVPMVIETSVGIDRTCLALLCDAYEEQPLEDGETRIVLRLHAGAGADQGRRAAALEEARRAGARAGGRAARGDGTSSTTTPATSAGATAARTRRVRRSASRSTSNRRATAASRCASAIR